MSGRPATVPGASVVGGGIISPAEAARRQKIRRTLKRQAAVRSVQAGTSGALRHGIYAEAAVADDVRDEAALLYARASHLDPVRDGHLVEATARIVVRLRKLDAALESAETQGSQTLTSMAARLEAQLARNLDALGLTPRSAHDMGLPARDQRTHAERLSEETLARYQQQRPEEHPNHDHD